MPTEKKVQQVADLAERLSRCTIAVATDYRGLTVAEITGLRRKLGEQGMEYKVVKNTLARLAAERSGREQIAPLLQGPTAIAFGFGEATDLARVLTEHIRAERSILSIKGALVGNRAYSGDQVNVLATLPSRKVLISKTLGSLKSPFYSLHFVLSAQLRGLVTVLNGRLKQLEAK